MPATAAENLDWIRDRWGHLLETRLRGTARPWKEPTLTPEQRARLDAEAHAEKRERGAFVLGESEAPLHLDTLDKIDQITTTIHQLTITTAAAVEHHALADALGRLKPVYRNTIGQIGYLRQYIPQLDTEQQEQARRTTARLRATMADDFAEVFDGKRLKADCPWCGQPKLFVRLTRNGEPLIVCESGTCEPPDADCGYTNRGNPAWPIHEWDWLANRMHHEDNKPKGVDTNPKTSI